MAIEFPEPHWEHGYRTHGYWVGNTTQVGRVCIGPSRFWRPSDGYSWEMNFPVDLVARGNAPTLKRAKRAVEKAFEAKRAEMSKRVYRIQ